MTITSPTSPYVRASLTPGTRILLVGEMPGDSEEREGLPFCGPSGYELDSQLRDAGLMRSDVSITNVIRFKHPTNDDEAWATPNKARAKREGLEYDPRYKLFLAPWVHEHIAALRREIEELDPNVIVPLGNLSMRVLTGERGITNWRGSLMESQWRRPDGTPWKVIPIVHPAAIFRQYSWRINSIFDWVRVRKHMGTASLTWPKYEFDVQPSWSEADHFLQQIEQGLKWFEDRWRCSVCRNDWSNEDYDCPCGAGNKGNSPSAIRLSVDIETTRKQISCIGIATSHTRAMCFPFFDPRKPGCSYWSETEEIELVWRLTQILAHPACTIIGQNFAYDKQYIARSWGCWPKQILDTGIGHHTLWPASLKKLGYLGSWYCENHRYWKDEGRGKEEKKEWGSKVDPETLWRYNLKDCVITYEVWDRVEELLHKQGLWPQFQFEMALEEPTSLRTLAGVRVDPKARQRMSNELSIEIEKMQRDLDYVVGHPLNVNSTARGGQLQRLFYDDMQLPVQLDRKTKQPSTAEDALHKLAAKQPLVKPIIDSISNIRSCNVFLTNYLGCQMPGDRMRFTYDVAGTVSFRFSGRKDPYGLGTNPQNRPKGGGKIAKLVREGPKTLRELSFELKKPPPEAFAQIEENKLYRQIEIEQESGLVRCTGQYPELKVHYQLFLPNVAEMFVPDPGCVIGDFDLARGDFYAVAWDAEATKLKQMLKERVDIHTENAKILRSTRDQAKGVHGFNYLGSAAAVAAGSGVLVHEAEQMKQRWFGEHPEIPRWHARVAAELKRTGGARNAFGFRVIYFNRIEKMLPEALAWIASSTVAIVTNLGYLRLHDPRLAIEFGAALGVWDSAHVLRQPKCEVLLQTHDSLTCQARIENQAHADDAIRSAMAVTVPYPDPLVIPVDGHWSRENLAKCKED